MIMRKKVYQLSGEKMYLSLVSCYGSEAGEAWSPKNRLMSIDVGELEILIVRPALHDATVQESCRTICLAPFDAYSGVSTRSHDFEAKQNDKKSLREDSLWYKKIHPLGDY